MSIDAGAVTSILSVLVMLSGLFAFFRKQKKISTEQAENDFKRGIVEGERLHLEKDLTGQIDSAHNKIRRIDEYISTRDKDDIKVKTELVSAVRGLNKAVDSINRKFDGLQEDISKVKEDVGIIKGRRDFSG